MATTAIVAARMQRAHERALEVLRGQGLEERVENLENTTVAQPTTRNPAHLASFQAEMLAALAEIVEGQEWRISKLEAAVAASEARPAKDKKSAPKGSRK